MKQDHKWLIALLEDLIQYATRKNLEDLSAALSAARMQAYIVDHKQNGHAEEFTNAIRFPVNDNQSPDD